MDELDEFWIGHFGVAASLFERRLIAQISKTILPGDPLFVLTAMLARQLYLSLDGKAKALLEFGPAITRLMTELEGATLKISSDLSSILTQAAEVKRNMVILDAHLIHQNRSVAQRVMERALVMLDSDLKTSLQWSVGLSFSFISGVVTVCIWTP